MAEITSPSAQKANTTIGKRLEILQKLEEGVNINTLATEYGVNRRTIQRYRKNSESIRQLSAHPSLKKKRTLVHRDTDNRLYSWILERQAIGDILTDNILQKKAKELHMKYNSSTSFSASRGWLWRFKKRHGIRFVNIPGEGTVADLSAANEFVKHFSEMLSEENISEENIYNMNETSLMWKALPRRALVNEKNQPAEGKKIKTDRITVGFCANATGMHRLPPLFVNKYVKPRALKHCQSILPVVYKSQTNARLDNNVFNDWYINNFKPCVREHQKQMQRIEKVLLIVDSLKEHTHSREVLEDPHFKLIFLPPHTAALIQPMNQEVITTCKQLYRQKLLRRVLQYNNDIRQFYADYDIKDCIDLINEAWREVTLTTIKYSWKKILSRPSPSRTFENQSLVEVYVKGEPDDIGSEILPAEEITEWISECERAELIVKEEEEDINTQSNCQIEEEEIDHMFDNLAIWAESQPNLIKEHAQILINYYNKK